MSSVSSSSSILASSHGRIAHHQRLLQMVRCAARRLQVQARLPLSVELDDLIQAGMLGLLEAERRYDDSLGACFETYASRRIQGAMLDELRSRDWLPRSVRRQAREAERVSLSLEQRYGGAVREREIAEVMEIPLAAYQRHLNDAQCGQLLAYQEEGGGEIEPPAGATAGPDERLLEEERKRLLREALVALEDPREREALSLHHLHGMSLRQIGERLGVSESRVCQLHRRAMVKLRNWLAVHHPG